MGSITTENVLVSSISTAEDFYHGLGKDL